VAVRQWWQRRMGLPNLASPVSRTSFHLFRSIFQFPNGFTQCHCYRIIRSNHRPSTGMPSKTGVFLPQRVRPAFEWALTLVFWERKISYFRSYDSGVWGRARRLVKDKLSSCAVAKLLVELFMSECIHKFIEMPLAAPWHAVLREHPWATPASSRASLRACQCHTISWLVWRIIYF